MINNLSSTYAKAKKEQVGHYWIQYRTSCRAFQAEIKYANNPEILLDKKLAKLLVYGLKLSTTNSLH
jgi:hypothetical protein